ncbi:hypothetical protein AB6A40_001794 [Gnathostoma spinigerum]|uniref:Spliceosome-associated protein CWC27 homolog n=1 Tax=Gnathostoma spinigerum TaxID=75299 RepID=A0ABD6E619_9BILA
MSSIYTLEPATTGKVCLKTTVGDIDIELWTKECPLASRNFIQLCMEGYYNGTIFHRMIKDFIVQGGDPTGKGTGGESIYGKPFKDEFHQRLKFRRRGLLGMANGGKKDDNGSQFFFTLGSTPDLDGKHTLFGKVVGDTLFNMLKLGEGETDENDRPLCVHKIRSAEILNCPFSDIKPREQKCAKKPKEEKMRRKKEEKQNLNLLSFGDEAEADEEELSFANSHLKSKSKSAHDILTDERLSKEVAVRPEELEEIVPVKNEGSEETNARLARIKEKLMSRKRKPDESDEGVDEDEDLNRIVDEETRKRQAEKLKEIADSLRAMQKDYKRALRKPKEKVEATGNEPQTEGMKMYEKLKLKFKSKSQNIVKQKDAMRETQTMKMLEKFKTRLRQSNTEAILFDRMPTVQEAEPTKKEETDTPLGKLDLDAEDLGIDECLNHIFVAPAEQQEVSRAKDANMRDNDEDWYDIKDPRNKMNKRRRGEE